MNQLPEVSLITSWCQHPAQPAEAEPSPPPGLKLGLQAGLRLFDLYFLSHSEIPWYAAAAGRPTDQWTETQLSCPLSFAAELKQEEVREIAKNIHKLMAREYGGRLVGPRPRITALATYWPLISETGESSAARRLSVRAVANSLLLARELGCRHVEIVGGAAYSEEDGRCSDGTAQSRLAAGQDGSRDREQIAIEIEQNRRNALCTSLVDVFATKISGSVDELLFPRDGDGPYLCLEAEPGTFLVRDVETYLKVRKGLQGIAPDHVLDRVLLNVDIAHMFLADTDESAASGPAGQRQLQAINDCGHVGHFHIADHARTHASDLCPGSYHFVEDYAPWLQLARKLTKMPEFSGVIAVEMESCCDLHEASRAISRTRNWLRAAQEMQSDAKLAIEPTGFRETMGVVMAVDIANSTEVLALGGMGHELASRKIEIAVSSVCRTIQASRGSVYSFTGDGALAVFEYRDFADRQQCVASAIEASENLYQQMKHALEVENVWTAEMEAKLALRLALHAGTVTIATGGPLKHQLIGSSAIIACRLLGNVDKGYADIRPWKAVWSGAFCATVPNSEVDWFKVPDDEIECKGLSPATIEVEMQGLYRKLEPPEARSN